VINFRKIDVHVRKPVDHLVTTSDIGFIVYVEEKVRKYAFKVL
jgi:hypothetical protein